MIKKKGERGADFAPLYKALSDSAFALLCGAPYEKQARQASSGLKSKEGIFFAGLIKKNLKNQVSALPEEERIFSLASCSKPSLSGDFMLLSKNTTPLIVLYVFVVGIVLVLHQPTAKARSEAASPPARCPDCGAPLGTVPMSARHAASPSEKGEQAPLKQAPSPYNTKLFALPLPQNLNAEQREAALAILAEAEPRLTALHRDLSQTLLELHNLSYASDTPPDALGILGSKLVRLRNQIFKELRAISQKMEQQAGFNPGWGIRKF